MAYVTPTTRATGYVVPATVWNSDVVENVKAVHTGEISLTSQVANALICAASTGALSVVAPAASAVLVSSTGSVPSMSQTLPAAVQANITAVGTVASGTFPAANLSGATLSTGVTGSSLTSLGTLSALTVNGPIAAQGTQDFSSTDSASALTVTLSSGTSLLRLSMTGGITEINIATINTVTAGRVVYLTNQDASGTIRIRNSGNIKATGDPYLLQPGGGIVIIGDAAAGVWRTM